MTEEEAKTKWCPLARVLATTGAVNRYGSGKPLEQCDDDGFKSSHGYCGQFGKDRRPVNG